ncbi:hypothetical protein FRB99_008078 [Tulasnella sp. 403]|nr:hypothetical protein FRB99_008078 [Tulasnella sp. 403]
MTVSSPSTRKPAPPLSPASLASPIDLFGSPDPVLQEATDDDASGAMMQMDKGKRRERPPALELAASARRDKTERHQDRTDSDRELERDRRVNLSFSLVTFRPINVTDFPLQQSRIQPTLNVGHPASDRPSDGPPTRTESSASSSALDSYYFSYPSPDIQTGQASPPPPLPASHSTQLAVPRTPDYSPFVNSIPPTASRHDPHTPARDPAAIDRRGLVGVGELATPRWAQAVTARKVWDNKGESVEEEPMEIAEDVLESDDVPNPWNSEPVPEPEPEIPEPVSVIIGNVPHSD